MRSTLVSIILAAALSAVSPAAFGQDTKAPATQTQDTKVQTTSEANRESLSGAAKAPLRDLNVIRTQVPDVLVQALADPYQRPTTKKCQELIALIQPLDQALGSDIDVPPTEEERTMAERGRPMALGAAAGLASDFIPFRGAVRYLTGAAKHDEYVQSAILAGSARRAYLKGLGEARGCKPPATPSHVRAGSTPPAAVNAGIDRGLKPRYPIKR